MQASSYIPTITRDVPLAHVPGVAIRVSNVHFADEAGMQVCIQAGAVFSGSNTYMTTSEARAVAAALIKCADHFDREAGKLPAVNAAGPSAEALQAAA